MKLFYSSSSPYARKVRVTAREKGLMGSLTEIECNPFADPAELRGHNQLGKVPTLVAGALVLYDSTVICEYLDSRTQSPRFIPMAGADRWRVLRAQALADGLLDLAVALTVEQRRPPAQQSDSTQQRWRGQIVGGMNAMHEQLPDLSGILNVGHIAFGVALGYLDFRYPNMGWRNAYPELANWFEGFDARPAMQATLPSDSSYHLPQSDAS